MCASRFAKILMLRIFIYLELSDVNIVFLFFFWLFIDFKHIYVIYSVLFY